MNQAKTISRISDSKPASVLSRIAAEQGHVVEHDASESTIVEALPPAPTMVIDDKACVDPISKVSTPTIKLRINPDTHPEFEGSEVIEGFLDSCIESAEQVQQLAQRLSDSQTELLAREVDLEKRVKTWNTRVEKLESEFEFKLRQLKQKSSHVRCQQLNLMQLQTDIVKSHEATRTAIESLVVQSGGDAQTIATLKALKYQLSGRFDYIARRWEHLAGLLQAQRDADVAEHAIDDTVDWAGKLT